ncbi:putative late blight resistance protein homolog R1B-12 [Lycium ferocissimum]|uniref:putative late blight resistance protein homolog R1B-12 n=1 Tax=Lycium ferocissimum TaxID=112874 RepID=UPI0028165EF1|nr:putative late blight resistance protein homolog R1B-12 [Lycium ferocissimum]
MAYAVVTSLMNTLGLLLMQTNSTQNRLHEKAEALNPQIESLREKVRSLQALLETLDNINDDESVKHGETKIYVAAHDAEDRIESTVGEIYKKKKFRAFKSLFESLREASESIDSERKELERCMKKGDNKGSLESLPQASSESIYWEIKEMKKHMKRGAYKRHLESLQQAFRSINSKRKELIGRMKKGVQAQQHTQFDLATLASEFETDCEKSDGDLAAEFKKKLQRGRYLIVIDDIWSTNAWDDISQWFPDYKGSQILLTTRCGNVASYAAHGSCPHQMSPLNPTESWELFQDKINVKEQFSLEFVEIGKNIVYSCQGLPLSIVVVAGFYPNAAMH